MAILDINKNVTLAHVEQHLKITSETIKNLFNHVKHKNDTELSKEFWKIKKPQQNTKNYIENYQNMLFLQFKQ